MHAKYFRVFVIFISLYGAQLMAVDEATYSLVYDDGIFEVRDYDAYLLAEFVVDSEFEEAGNKAFRSLFKYISGDNQSQEEISMTAPVTQKSVGEVISMTAPVIQKFSQNQYVISFMMPDTYTMQTIPKPSDPAISIRYVEPQRMAVVKYSGFWSKSNYEKNRQLLDTWVVTQNLKVTGDHIWARYNAPFSLWFTRRNEIMLPITRKE